MTVIDQVGFEDKCTGCSACYNICPTKAISMEMNNEGFYYPKINEDLCVNCGKCLKVCSINHKVKQNAFSKKCILLRSSDEIREKSSSGGAFYQLCQYALNKKGRIYGAAFLPQKKMVCHTDSLSVDLEKIMKSKYVQSNIGDTFYNVKNDLDNEIFVLFSGTPCQVAGLKKFLVKDYKNLLTIDFVCHGVPSTGLFIDTVKWYEKRDDSKIIDVTFREKDLGWRNQVTKFYFENGKVIREKSSNFYYYYLFLRNITLRKSCYSCENPLNYQSDFTLMDHWGIKGDDDKGTSAVCINTEKGHLIFDNINKTFHYEDISINDILCVFIPHAINKSYYRLVKKRNEFFSFYEENGINSIVKTWFPDYYRKSKTVALLKRYPIKIRNFIRKFVGK